MALNDAIHTGTPSQRPYVNYFQIGHNAMEVVLECGQYYAGDEQALIVSQVITSPYYAKRLLKLLHDALKQYEEEFGSIPNSE